ncbi:MAG: tyrosine-type recombinase/integrase [Deltaproteobacteria bacterium]|nr:tyrosine-type recombinase/integrase [Deltaproteobacteria bacterium]
MDRITIEDFSITSAKESLTDFGSNDLQAGFLPSIILPEIYRGKSGKVFSGYTQEARALHWALDRLARWELPGKEHVEEYIRSMYRRNFRPRTYASALTAIYVFLTGVRDSGKTRLEEITKNDVEAFIEHEQDRGLMLSTVRTKLHCVNAFLGYAIDAGVVSTDVLARRIRLKKPETLPRAMDPDDVKQLLSVIDNPKNLAMIMVLLRTGIRIGELLNTKMQDLHLKDRRIDIYEGEKNRLGRVVYLSDDAMSALRAWLKIRDAHKVFLFYAQGKTSMSYSTARQIFVDYLTKAGLPHKGYSLHVLRHTFASELLNAGMRIECLQPLMGHTSLDVTRRYARLTDKTREEEYFRAMTVIERGEIDGHYRCDHQIQTLLEEKERLTEYR